MCPRPYITPSKRPCNLLSISPSTGTGPPLGALSRNSNFPADINQRDYVPHLSSTTTSRKIPCAAFPTLLIEPSLHPAPSVAGHGRAHSAVHQYTYMSLTYVAYAHHFARHRPHRLCLLSTNSASRQHIRQSSDGRRIFPPRPEQVTPNHPSLLPTTPPAYMIIPGSLSDELTS